VNDRFFWYENPDTGNQVKVWYYDIQDLAFEEGDDRRVEDMPDDDFYRYVNILLENK
jgi:hypothetical protein